MEGWWGVWNRCQLLFEEFMLSFPDRLCLDYNGEVFLTTWPVADDKQRWVVLPSCHVLSFMFRFEVRVSWDLKQEGTSPLLRCDELGTTAT